MIYQAKVLRIDEIVEEEVTLQIGNTELTCFASMCPCTIGEESSYPLELILYDGYVVEEVSDDTEPSIVRLGNTFAHVITGRLNGRCLESEGLTFEDDALLSDFGYLDGKMVAMKVGRIDAYFNPE
ncbi:MAG: hypothetical protein LBI92_02535 [Azoarcus sp.]|jgi:hypothetical protein|nr:hypothetical protein [Azoarcus sp.]